MPFFNLTILKLLFLLIIGILLAPIASVGLTQSIWLVSGFLFFSILCQLFWKLTYFAELSVGLLILSLGVSLATVHNHQLYDSHYTQLIPVHDIQIDTLILRVNQELKPTFSSRYIVSIEQAGAETTFGKILMYAPIGVCFEVDDRLMTKADIKPISSAKNPFQFDYQSYLARRNIFGSVTVNDSSYFFITPAKTIGGWANTIRKRVFDWIEPWKLNDNSYAIFEALVLGRRHYIPQELQESFERAGVVHILAISGLHIGIIMLFFNWLLKPLHLLPYGRVISLVFTISFLWCFALVSGLSPSVTRAVGMFTLLAVSMSVNRRTKLINTLMAAAFLSLLIDPFMLYEIGFQLSYMSVLSIILFTPLIQHFWKAKHTILVRIRDALTVTMAAQIGVLPLSLFYFHQFPGLFLLANFVLLPLVFVVLLWSFVLVILGSIGFYHPVFGNFYQSLITFLIGWVDTISSADQFYFNYISFNWIEVVVCYLTIFILFRFFRKPRAQRLQHLLICIIGMLSIGVYYSYRARESEFVIFQKGQHTLIGIKHGSSAKFYHDLEDEVVKSDQTIRDYRIGTRLKSTRFQLKTKLLQFDNQLWLVLDSTGLQRSPSFPIHGLVLTQSPRLNLDRWLDSIKPNIVVADGSNYTSYINRWEATCSKKNIHFHRTDSDGAYIIRADY